MHAILAALADMAASLVHIIAIHILIINIKITTKLMYSFLAKAL